MSACMSHQTAPCMSHHKAPCMSHHTAPCMHESSRQHPIYIYSRPCMALCLFCMYQLLRFTGLEAAPNRPCTAQLPALDILIAAAIRDLASNAKIYARKTAFTGLSSCSCIWQACHFQMWPHKQLAQQVPLQTVKTSNYADPTSTLWSQ